MDASFFFPKPKRDFYGQRWVRITLRTMHLLAMALMVGGFARGFSAQEMSWEIWGTLATGIVFILVELYSSCVWILQLKGWAVIVKILLLAGVLAAPQSAMPLLIAAIVIGGISAHMPGKYRYFSPIHGRVVKE